MKILFVVSEVEDLVKTGGLADVAKALPLALKAKGHDVRIVKPFYKALADFEHKSNIVLQQTLYSDQRPYRFDVKQLSLQDVPVYCVDYPDFYHREGLYSDGYYAYEDNAERFAFFSQAALQTAKAIDFKPDIIHCNDWHTALVPYFVDIDQTGFFDNSKTLLTIHNGAYQGTHKFDDIPFLRPHQDLRNQLDGDALNYVRMGIRYADKINAVSPNYAQELLSPLGSHNLYHEFKCRELDVSGILNGCDYSQWDPATDKHLPATYSADNISGKAVCKETLQRETGLPVKADVPLIGMVCRLTEQKGFGFMLPALSHILVHNMQLVIVGTGDPAISEALREQAAAFSDKFVFIEDFNVRLAHLVEAGSDFFLMPSLFEPCGLNQMYSLAYGTLPIVRAVGGLKDTVVDWQDDAEHATGFLFEKPRSDSLLACVLRALLFYREFPEQLETMKLRAMNTHFTWDEATDNYIKLYQSMSQ